MPTRKGRDPEGGARQHSAGVGRHWNHAFRVFPDLEFWKRTQRPLTKSRPKARSGSMKLRVRLETAVSRRWRGAERLWGFQTCRRCLVTALSSSARFCGHCGATLSERAGVHVCVRRRSGNRVKVAIDRHNQGGSKTGSRVSGISWPTRCCATSARPAPHSWALRGRDRRSTAARSTRGSRALTGAEIDRQRDQPGTCGRSRRSHQEAGAGRAPARSRTRFNRASQRSRPADDAANGRVAKRVVTSFAHC